MLKKTVTLVLELPDGFDIDGLPEEITFTGLYTEAFLGAIRLATADPPLAAADNPQ